MVPAKKINFGIFFKFRVLSVRPLLEDECKVLGNFDYKYTKVRPTKEHRKEPTTRKCFERQQYNNDILQQVVDEIMLQ